MLAALVRSACTLALAFAMPASSATPEERCQDAIALRGSQFLKARLSAIARCEEQRARGALASTANCRPAAAVVDDAKTERALARARGRFGKKVRKACAGIGVPTLSLGAPCAARADVDELVACLADTAFGRWADELTETAFGPAEDVPVAEKTAQQCRKALAREAERFALTRMKQRRSCAKKLLAGKSLDCPDEKIQARFDKARGKLIAKVVARCGDAELAGAPPPIDLGFPCDSYEIKTFVREPGSDDNRLPLGERAARCLADTSARIGDLGAQAAHALPDRAPFSMGVAAGDPTTSAFVAWTRLGGGGTVTLEVATDPGFATIVFSAAAASDPAADDTVKIEVTGLVAATPHWYRFSAGADTSRSGRVVTAPEAGGPVTFAFSGDSNASALPFHVLEQVTRAEPDLFLYVGDLIYGDNSLRSVCPVATARSDYHCKYRENRADRSLRDLLATTGTVSTWDDHEVVNDFWGTDPAVQAQMAEGNQALRDYFPIREDAADPMRLYRSFRWGDVAEFFVLDVRQYRDPPAHVTEPACLDGGVPATLPNDPACLAELDDPARTYLGTAQRSWLEAGLQASTATFKFLLNGPPVSALLFLPFDRWEGYASERQALLDFVAAEGITGVVFLTTDFHTAIVNDAVSPQVRELIAGPIGTGTFFRALPASLVALLGTLPAIFPSISFAEYDRFNVVTATASSEEVRFEYLDAAGNRLHTVVIPAEVPQP